MNNVIKADICSVAQVKESKHETLHGKTIDVNPSSLDEQK